MTEVARLTAALENLLQQMSREDWLGHLARAKSVEASEAALAAEKAEFAKQKAAFKLALDELVAAEPA